MFNPSQSEVRQFFVAAWRARLSGQPVVGAQKVAAEVAARHPEYHALLASDSAALERQYSPEDGVLNPFLHLSLHLAVEEQLAIDQPPGLRAGYLGLLRQCNNEHEAQHAVMECLGEVLWQAQRQGTGPDGAAYIACLNRRLRHKQPEEP